MGAAANHVVGHRVVRYVFGAALLLAAACGGSSKPAAKPISNTDKPAPPDTSSGPGEGRVIQRTQTGGVIELSGDRGAAMKQADEEMSSHCGPSNYTIVQEGEEAVASEGSMTRDSTAWRVHYQCNGN
jgi:hypothetical protein